MEEDKREERLKEFRIDEKVIEIKNLEDKLREAEEKLENSKVYKDNLTQLFDTGAIGVDEFGNIDTIKE